MQWEQEELPGMPQDNLRRAEGALVTVWRSVVTGYHEATVVSFSADGSQVTTVFDDAGPFDITEALKVHSDHLRSLGLL